MPAIAALALIAAAGGVYYIGAYRGSGAHFGWQTYATTTFSVSYPGSYTPDGAYTQDIAAGRRSTGVKLTVPARLASGTNLSADSFISVEALPTMVDCSATPYLYDAQTLPPVTEEGHVYSIARQDGAGAGNRYEEQVFVRTDEKPCLAVRYYIHSTNLGNYEEGTVREFDRAALLAEFDRVRYSLIVK